jgi:hypothetical protein
MGLTVFVWFPIFCRCVSSIPTPIAAFNHTLFFQAVHAVWTLPWHTSIPASFHLLYQYRLLNVVSLLCDWPRSILGWSLRFLPVQLWSQCSSSSMVAPELLTVIRSYEFFRGLACSICRCGSFVHSSLYPSSSGCRNGFRLAGCRFLLVLGVLPPDYDSILESTWDYPSPLVEFVFQKFPMFIPCVHIVLLWSRTGNVGTYFVPYSIILRVLQSCYQGWLFLRMSPLTLYVLSCRGFPFLVQFAGFFLPPPLKKYLLVFFWVHRASVLVCLVSRKFYT